MALANKRWTAEEYLAFEASSEEKHEFFGGEVYLMTGASDNHNLIVASTLIALGAQRRGRPCKIYPSDMLVHIASVGDYFYPDLMIVCGQAEVVHVKRDMLLNPTVVIEVLSPSTEMYDRVKKFEGYRTLDSLQEYVLIAQDRPHIERYTRQDKGWLFIEANGLDETIDLASISFTLALREVYDQVTFEQE
jgi:Uma2 family endonuclease